MNDISLRYDRNLWLIMATHCTFLKKFQFLNCNNSYNIYPCVKYVKNKISVKFISKEKQHRNCENVIAK